MKKLIFFIAFCQIGFSQSLSSLEDAKKIAIATNKLIIIDFTASWCKPCIKMQFDTWSDEQVKEVLDNFVFVKINFDSNKDLVNKYNVKGIPNILVLDGTGLEIDSFLGYKNATDFIRDVDKYSINTEYLSSDLISQYKFPCFYNSFKIAIKYYEFSLFLDKTIKNEFITLATDYLMESKKYLHKKDENYLEKKQKLELANLFYYAYKFDFDKLEKKLADLKVKEIHQNNLQYYWFLRYLVSKNSKSDDLSLVETNFKLNENYDYMNAKANLVLNKFNE